MILNTIFLIFGILCFSVVFNAESASLNGEVAKAGGKSVITKNAKESNDSNSNKNDYKEDAVEDETKTKKLFTFNEKQNKSTPHVRNVMQMTLRDEDKLMLENLNGVIESKVPEIPTAELIRQGKSFKDEYLKRAAEALTDEEITEIVKSISFPNEDEITEDSEALNSASETEVEPRMLEDESLDKSLKGSQGYYVVVFTPVDEENNQHEIVPYSRLQIIPAERSLSGDASDNPRLISRKSWNKYIRRIMRQIRKGTRIIQHGTKAKALKEESTVENFLRRMYKVAQAQQLRQLETNKKSSWFIW